jgi:hypothetical protein
MMLAATLATGAQPDTAAQPLRCPATQVKVSKLIEPEPVQAGQPLRPQSKAKAKEPSVLLPKCEREDDPKKKDYPLA